MRPLPIILAPALAATLALAGCTSGGAVGPASIGGGSALSPAEFEALYRARTESARSRFTPADVAFMSGMIHHHAQALVMSAMAPGRAASPAVKTLAARIINAQRDEIELMLRWLRDRNQPVPELHGEGTSLMVHGGGQTMQHGEAAHASAAHGMHGPGGDHALMPGMLTPAQLAELEQARGAEFDRLFLTYMIQHHSGAIVMVRELFATDGAGQDEEVFKFASDVQVDQATEIDRMQRMLAQPAPAGPAR